MWNMFKDNNKDTRVFIVNFEHVSHLDLVFLLLILSRLIPTGKVSYQYYIITLQSMYLK